MADTLAPAKVNLFLHVGPVEADGYHPVASLAAFADVGDRVRLEPSDQARLTIEGPFAGALADEPPERNLILRALTAAGAPPFAVTLDKQLPVAAGLGGGSSDAGAALRLARDLGLAADDATLERAASAIGADGPMCLWARPCLAEGRGERLTPEPQLPPLPAVLINPGVPSPTGAVYRAYDAHPNGAADRPEPPADWTIETVIAWLADQRNDLEAPAIALEPRIGEALAAAAALPGARLARMSGSGATVFALFAEAAEAEAAARTLAEARPDWWVRSCRLGSPLTDGGNSAGRS